MDYGWFTLRKLASRKSPVVVFLHQILMTEWFVTHHAELQWYTNIWNEIPEHSFTITRTDNIDKLQSYSAVYCCDQQCSFPWHDRTACPAKTNLQLSRPISSPNPCWLSRTCSSTPNPIPNHTPNPISFDTPATSTSHLAYSNLHHTNLQYTPLTPLYTKLVHFCFAAAQWFVFTTLHAYT